MVALTGTLREKGEALEGKEAALQNMGAPLEKRKPPCPRSKRPPGPRGRKRRRVLRVSNFDVPSICFFS